MDNFKVKVLGEKYDIELVESNEDINIELIELDSTEESQLGGFCFGLCDDNNNKITISKSIMVNNTKEPLSNKKKLITAYHELTHAYMDSLNPNVTDNEVIVESIASMLYHMLHVDKSIQCVQRNIINKTPD